MTKISWTDSTWNPAHGCTKISAGCKNCYAERMSRRLAGRHGYPPAPDNFKVTLRPDRLEQPLKWCKPRRVFVCSMSDLFHRDVPDDFIQKVFAVMALGHQHTFQVLTKRPERMRVLLASSAFKIEVGNIAIVHQLREGLKLSERNFDTFRRRVKWPLSNVWLGVTVENQATADERIPLLLKTPAAVRFVSAEPLLGALNLSQYLGVEYDTYYEKWVQSERGCISGRWWLDLVITGGETGPGARPTPPGSFEALRDQCLAAQVPFHFKGHGEWIDYQQAGALGCRTVSENRGRLSRGRFDGQSFPLQYIGQVPMLRIGNKRGGNLLDGTEWQQMPEVTK